MKRLSSAWGAVAMLIVASAACGQGVIVVIDPPRPIPLPRPIPRPTPSPASYKIKELHYQGRILDQVAELSVTQTFVNTGSGQIEASFLFPLPYDAAIDRMTFLVDGKEYDAKILPAKDAKQIYESHVRRNQDPALLEWIGHGLVQTSVFPIPPGAERKVILKFSQLLRKDNRLTDFLIPLSTAKYTSSPIEKLSINLSLESAEELKSVYSPTHAINVQRSDSKHAAVKFEATSTVPTTDFRLFFDTADGKLSASVVSYRPATSDDGFFLLLASPEIKAAAMDRPAKTVVFVVDRSGSMSGKKIEQAKEALKFVLNNLRSGDTFNIVAYDSNVESFRPELQKFDEETRKAALGFVESLFAGGSTNIDGALGTALAMIKDDSRPNFVLFLTDGLPTAGETSEAKIAANAKANNKLRTRMINLGVGYDVNSRLLDRLSRQNYGQSGYVRPDESIEAHVSRLYNKLGAPVMTNVVMKMEVEGATVESGSGVSRIYPREVYDLFAGEQVVLVGRYKKSGGAKVTITGKVGSEEQQFDFPAALVEKSGDQRFAFVEKLWAMRRIGEIIDELDLKGKNEELIKELVTLSTQHGILTPYTSFLADEHASVQKLAAVGAHFEFAGRAVDRLGEAGGIAGFSQRAEKEVLQNAQLAPAAAAPAFGASGGGERLRGLSLGSSAAGGRVANVYRDIDSDKAIVASGIQCAGKETLYRCGNVWVANNAKHLDPEKDTDKIKRIKRFSDEYFVLASANTSDENAILASQQEGEELLCMFRGQAYRIE